MLLYTILNLLYDTIKKLVKVSYEQRDVCFNLFLYLPSNGSEWGCFHNFPRIIYYLRYSFI
jgi:hypothetical protein